MEDIYKLQEVQDTNIFSYKLKKYLFIIWLLGSIFSIGINMNLNWSKFTNMIVSIMCVIGYSGIILPFILMIHFFPQYNKDYKNIKDTGEKHKSYIIDTGFSSHRILLKYKYFYITILYKEKNVKIYRLKDNKAYKILQLLLDSQTYPVKDTIEIPIDIYVYKNKIYADLESVNLSSLSGYDDAKQIVDNNI